MIGAVRGLCTENGFLIERERRLVYWIGVCEWKSRNDLSLIVSTPSLNFVVVSPLLIMVDDGG